MQKSEKMAILERTLKSPKLEDTVLMTLTKATIASELQEQLDLPRKESEELIETLLEIIKKNLESGDDVLVSGFGKFKVKEKTARKGRNPATGEDLTLAPRRVVTFACSNKLRDRVNGK